MRSAFRPPTALGLTALLAVVTVLAGPAGAGAGTPAPPAGQQSGLTARLIDFPIAVGPADALRVSLEVTNSGDEPAGNLEVGLVIYRGVRSRSELSQTYRGRFGRAVASDTIAVEGTVDPGRSRVIEVSKPLAELDAFRGSTTDRAYPVRITVRSGDIATKPIDTHLVFFSQTPEKPLGVGLVIPLSAPSIYTDASRPDVVTSDSLARSVTTGRLRAILQGLERYPNLPVTLAPSGLLISMLADMSDGYVRATKRGTVVVDREDARALAAGQALDLLRNLVRRPNTRLITTSYSPISLPALNRFTLEDLAVTQLTEGRNILKAEPVGLLRAQAMPGWLMPAGGDLDDSTLTELQRSDSNFVILSSRSVSGPSGPFTRGLPVSIEGGSGSATSGLQGTQTIGLVADAGLDLQLRDGHEQGAIESRQRFAAETATIQLESPGLVRAVVALAPLDWEVAPGNLEGLLATLSTAPWLITTTPDQIVSGIKPPSGQQVRLATPQSVLAEAQILPPAGYFSRLGQAQRSIDRFALLAPPPAQLGALTRRLLIAQSTDWWTSRAQLARGTAFARSVSNLVSNQLKLIKAPAPQTITLTSRTGVIPLSVGSALKYPVDIVIRLESDKLRFPDGNRIAVSKLRPPNQTIRVRAITKSSGTFPLRVRVLTPGGQPVSDSLLTIRSTAYNIVALSITGGAAIFLIGWWMIGAARRRLARRAGRSTV